MPWVDDANAPLLTDLYELTMLQAYFEEHLEDRAVFSLFARRLPKRRNFLLACGLEDALRYLEHLRFDDDALARLEALHLFPPAFLERLAHLRFTGDVWAVPEGTPVFGNEPILEICAPLPEAQLAESFLLNVIHLQTLIASKAIRVVLAAGGRRVVDFGLRRTQGADAGLKGARAMYVAGVDATSNVLAGCQYGIPIAGTMAHSYIQAHAGELEAFRSFAQVFPKTILLVDTYDTLQGVAKVIELSRELGARFEVRGIRLDSGDLGELAKGSRALLDQAGLQRVEIFASGGLDEDAIAQLLAAGAPIDAFGVGTAMVVSDDAPALDVAYKLVSYAGKGRLKLSTGKTLFPGQKQVFRREEHGLAVGDTLALHGESLPGRPLLHQVMREGRRLGPEDSLDALRKRTREELAHLPESLRALTPAPYPVEPSAALVAERDRVVARLVR